MKMNEILKMVLSVSVSASFLIVLLMIFRPLYQKRFSRRWQYYIWLVVIVRLVFLWNPGNGIVGQFFQEKPLETWMGQVLEAQKGSVQENLREEMAARNLSSQNAIEPNGNVQEDSRERVFQGKPALNKQTLLQNIWVLWLAVTRCHRDGNIYADPKESFRSRSTVIYRNSRKRHISRSCRCRYYLKADRNKETGSMVVWE